uniref:Chemokine interleukin-8-like domain-containing protein n=1 Tax=Monopterus albus TaxID=43700 RepID=A0A3Q3KA34_MONAL
MDLRVAVVIVCLCAVAIISTEAGIPKCCVKTQRFIHPQLLRNVQKVVEQNEHDGCDISARILYIKGLNKPVCADPMLKIKKMTKRRKMRLNKYKPSK